MGTDISHIVKHDFKLFHDRNASKTYCESILSHLRKEFCWVMAIPNGMK